MHGTRRTTITGPEDDHALCGGVRADPPPGVLPGLSTAAIPPLAPNSDETPQSNPGLGPLYLYQALLLFKFAVVPAYKDSDHHGGPGCCQLYTPPVKFH